MNIWLLLFSAVAVFAIIIGPGIWRARRFSGSASWPTLPATVERVLVHSRSGRFRTYRAEILYSYYESGEYYSGSCMGRVCGSEAEVNALFVDAYPRGTILQVHVHPTKPRFSVPNLGV